MLGVVLIFSFFAFIVIGSLILLAAATVAVRLWWFRRQMLKASAGSAQHDRSAQTDGVIEGEYRVVRDRENNRHP